MKRILFGMLLLLTVAGCGPQIKPGQIWGYQASDVMSYSKVEHVSRDYVYYRFCFKDIDCRAPHSTLESLKKARFQYIYNLVSCEVGDQSCAQ